MNRTLAVVRMQLINRMTYIWVPLIILAGAFVIAWAIYAMIPVSTPKYGGGAQAPLWYFMVVGIQALTLTFPFSQAMSVTRRDFYVGTLLTAALTSALLAAVFVGGGLIEMATSGWGVNGYFFSLPWVWELGAGAAWLVYFVMAMFFFVIGFWGATIYKRFGNVWLTVMLVGVGLVMVGIVWLITATGSWPQVAGWFVSQGAVGLSLWGLLLVAVLAATSFTTLRRAIP